jgi:hypothetical protein
MKSAKIKRIEIQLILKYLHPQQTYKELNIIIVSYVFHDNALNIEFLNFVHACYVTCMLKSTLYLTIHEDIRYYSRSGFSLNTYLPLYGTDSAAQVNATVYV